MNCDDIRALLPGWADKDRSGLSEEERRQVASHLETCPDCQQALKDLEESLSLVRTLPRISVPYQVQERAISLGHRRAHEMESQSGAFVAALRMAPPRSGVAPRTMSRERREPDETAALSEPEELPTPVAAKPLASGRETNWILVIVVVAVIAVLVYWLLR